MFMLEDISIIEVDNNKLWKQFLMLPWKIYENDPNWVPPLLFEIKKLLNPSKNPFFKEAKVNYWIAVINGNFVGRIAAIIDSRHNTHHNDKVGFFGYFECIDNDLVANKLFDTASDWIYQHKMVRICGPVNLSTSNECGLLIEGFDNPAVIQMTYNPFYYIKLINNYGFKKEIDLLAYQLITENVLGNNKLIQKLKRLNAIVSQKENIKFRIFNLKDFPNELERVRQLFNDYMSDNWGFVPIEKDEFKFIGASLKQILVKELAIFAEVDGRPVGFSIALPDINEVFKRLNGKLFPVGIFKYFYFKNKITGFRVILMGINKPYRKKGLEAVFYYHTLQQAIKRNFSKVELSWISEKNIPLVQAMVNMNAQLYKRYRIYEKDI